MKRGFLNSKKAKEPLSHSKVEAAVSKKVPSSRELPEQIIGLQLKKIQTNLGASPHYQIFRLPSSDASSKGSSVCVIQASTRSAIERTPGYPAPMQRGNASDVVFPKSTANMGIGLFAKRGFKMHELMFSERALLIFPKAIPTLPGFDPTIAPEEDVKKMSGLVFEKTMEQALGMMTEEDAKEYRKLSNCHKDSPGLFGIGRTNAFGAKIEEEDYANGKFGYAAVGKLGSRINHSCIPNTNVLFDVASFSLQVTAIRDIAAGDQLFYSYCREMQSVNGRREQLATYCFVCECKACTKATPESDKLREEVMDRIEKIVEDNDALIADPRFNVRSLDPLLKLEKDINNEGLDTYERYPEFLYAIMKGYEKLNNMEKTREYWYKVTKYMRPED